MRDRNVKMWMNFSFLDRNVSDNEMDKKNGEYIKSGCGIDEKCEEIYISSISDFVVSDFFILKSATIIQYTIKGRFMSR